MDLLGRRAMLAGGLAMGLAGKARAAGWDDILLDGRGQTVAFHASGGDERTNAFITWAGKRVRALYGIDLRQMKLPDTAQV